MRAFQTSTASKTAFISLSRPRLRSADSVTTGTPLISGKTSSRSLSTCFSRFCLSSTRSHLLRARTTALPSCATRSHERQILALDLERGIDQHDHAIGKADGAQGVGHRELLDLAGHARFAPDAGRVPQGDRRGRARTSRWQWHRA